MPGVHKSRATAAGATECCTVTSNIYHSSGAQNFEVAPRFLENLCNPHIQIYSVHTHTHTHPHTHTQGSLFEIQTPAQWNLIGCDLNMLSPSSTLLSPSSNRAFIPEKKSERVETRFYFISLLLKKFVSEVA
jgi:hypothetical protein